MLEVTGSPLNAGNIPLTHINGQSLLPFSTVQQRIGIDVAAHFFIYTDRKSACPRCPSQQNALHIVVKQVATHQQQRVLLRQTTSLIGQGCRTHTHDLCLMKSEFFLRRIVPRLLSALTNVLIFGDMTHISQHFCILFQLCSLNEQLAVIIEKALFQARIRLPIGGQWRDEVG